jgi:hypothetical protein
MDAVSNVPVPANEPVRGYAPGSAERAALESRVKELSGATAELTMTIGGERRGVRVSRGLKKLRSPDIWHAEPVRQVPSA